MFLFYWSCIENKVTFLCISTVHEIFFCVSVFVLAYLLVPL